MVKHSNKYWAGRLNAETSYASGSHTDAYEQQKLSDIVGMAYPKSYSDKMYPFQRTLKEMIESQDDGAYGGIRVDSGWISDEGTREEYAQDSFYLDHVIATITSGYENIPNSYALHWQDHIHDAVTPANDTYRFESYGCYTKNLKFVIPTNDGTKESFPSWQITDSCYSSKYETGVGTDVDSLVKTPWLVIASNPISTRGKAYINTNEIKDFESEIDIKLNYDEDIEAGDNGNKYPYFNGAEISFKVKIRDYDSYILFLNDLLDSVDDETLFDVKIDTGITDVFINATNMSVSESTMANIHEKGLTKYDVTFISTKDTVLSKSAS